MKIRNDYLSILNGVSQQPPHAMLPGQHVDQVNMHSDPVYGLTRRWGTTRTGQTIAGYGSREVRSFDWRVGGKEYAVLYGPGVVDQDLVSVYDKEAQVFLNVTNDPADTAYLTARVSGVRALTAVGEYLVLASDALPSSSTTSARPVWSDSNTLGALWVRGGAYSRKVVVRLQNPAGNTMTVTDISPDSTFPEVLDIGNIRPFVPDPAGGTETTRESLFGATNLTYSPSLVHRLTKGNLVVTGGAFAVYDINGTLVTNSYPSAPSITQYSRGPGWDFLLLPGNNPTDWYVVYDHRKALANAGYTAAVSAAQSSYSARQTAYILDAAAKIAPAAIAARIAGLINGSPPTAGGIMSAIADGEHVRILGARSISVEDGGDGTLIEAVDNTIAAVTDLTKKFWVGSVVRIKPADSDSVFYMRAINAAATDGAFTDVSWEESAAAEWKVTGGLIYGKISGGALRLGSSPAFLASQGVTDSPAWATGVSGDADTNPVPYFVGRRISYLGVFQNRLLVGSNGVINASRVGDYLNFSRATVLSALANDPVELISQGSEDDTIVGGAFFDRNLVLFGKRQYVLDGGTPLSITSALMPVLSSHAGANEVPPVAAGTSIYYAKRGPSGVTVQQMQPGAYADSADSFGITPHLGSYLGMVPRELTVCHEPTMLALRTDVFNTVFILRYLDEAGGGRKQSAWGRWTYDASLGELVATSYYPGKLLLFFIKPGPVDILRCEEQPLATGRSPKPYMDSLAPGSSGIQARQFAAYDNTGRQYLGDAVGDSGEGFATLVSEFGTTGLWVGTPFDSSVTLNRPFIYNQDKAELSGDLTVSRIYVKVHESGSARAFVYDKVDDILATTEDLTAYVSSHTVIGEVPLTSDTHDILIAQAADDYSLTVQSKDWLPLAITGVRWEGQYFNRTQKA